MKTHLITGAASGIGFELARTLLSRGDAVMACDINTAPMESLRAHAAAPELIALRRLDVRDPAQWEQVMREAAQLWPRLDTVMNVAGVLRPAAALDIAPADIDLHFDVNTKGVILGTQAAIRLMRNQRDENGRGHIINMASMSALTGVPGIALYSASKFAVRGYSLSIVHELRRQGIFLTVICPAAVATPLVEPYKHQAAAAMLFIAPLLTVEKLVRTIVGRAMARRPIELTLPGRLGLLAKVAGSFPSVAALLVGRMTRTGLRNQSRMK
jgi:3-oxoacyl-[acyl-carrier protein] reductase